VEGLSGVPRFTSKTPFFIFCDGKNSNKLQRMLLALSFRGKEREMDVFEAMGVPVCSGH
jgi:hypothetical protein